MKLGIGISSTLALLALSCQPTPAPAPKPDVRDGASLDAPLEPATCTGYCATLRKFACTEGASPSCVDTCERVQRGVDGVPLTDLHVDCVVNAGSVEVLRSTCGVKCVGAP